MGTIEKITSSLNNPLVILTIFALILYYFIDKITNRKTIKSNAIFAIAILYLTKPFTDIPSILLNWVQTRLGVSPSEFALSDGYYFVFGVILLLISKYLFQQKRPLLNMLGIYSQTHVNQVGCSGELTGVEFDERFVKFTKLIDKSGKTTQSSNKNICEEIEDECKLLVGAALKSKRAYVTGMSPIPYEVYAGTFLNGSNVNDYLEYDSKGSKKFYALKKRCSILQKLFGKHILAMEVSEDLSETEDLNLIISVSSKITDEDVIQFQSFSNVKVDLSEIRDNAIKEKEQLTELKNAISSLMEKYGKIGYKRIHITAAIPTCLAVEIGKEIAHLGNRLPEIVVYHYVKTSENKYPFGLIVSGKKKGSLYHV